MPGVAARSDGELATPTEARVAAALERCGVRWSYEPHRFVIERDDEGRELLACAPDFHLPAMGLYLEVCDGSPRRLNRKRAKLRRLAAVFPQVRVELVGPREIESLDADPARFLAALAPRRAA